MDNFTYGDSKAAMLLSHIIEENEEKNPNSKISKKVGRIWSDFTSGLKGICESNLPKTLRNSILRLWSEKYVQRCRKSTVPLIVRTYLENAIVTRFKMAYHGEFNENSHKKVRK